MESENYTRLTEILNGIYYCPVPSQREEELNTIIDMLWQVIPLEKEKEFFKTQEIKELEDRAKKWKRKFGE